MLGSFGRDRAGNVSHLPPRAGEIKDSLADIGLAKRVLGYSPRYTVEEGLALTIGQV